MNCPRDESTNSVSPEDVSMKDKFEMNQSFASGEVHELYTEDPVNASSMESLL
jgi:hypothetical protein